MDVGESAQLALERMKHCPQPGEHFRHYKGTEVEVVSTSIMEEDMDVLITYRELPTGRLWTRRFNSFTGYVHIGYHLPPEPVKRFTKVG